MFFVEYKQLKYIFFFKFPMIVYSVTAYLIWREMSWISKYFFQCAALPSLLEHVFVFTFLNRLTAKVPNSEVGNLECVLCINLFIYFIPLISEYCQTQFCTQVFSLRALDHHPIVKVWLRYAMFMVPVVLYGRLLPFCKYIFLYVRSNHSHHALII